MSKKILAATVSISIVIILAFELIMSIPPAVECGTAGIDFIPCAYWERVIWYMKMGSWLPLFVFFVILAIGYLLYKRSKTKNK